MGQLPTYRSQKRKLPQVCPGPHGQKFEDHNAIPGVEVTYFENAVENRINSVNCRHQLQKNRRLL